MPRPRKDYDDKIEFGTQAELKAEFKALAKSLGKTTPDLLNDLMRRAVHGSRVRPELTPELTSVPEAETPPRPTRSTRRRTPPRNQEVLFPAVKAS